MTMLNWISVNSPPSPHTDVFLTDGVNIVVGFLDSYGQWCPSNVTTTYDMAEAMFDSFDVTHWSEISPAMLDTTNTGD